MANYKARCGGWALVTGGTSGIGAQIVRQLAAGGLDIVTVARSGATLESAAEAVRKEFGVQVRTIVADLTAPDGVSTVIEGVRDLDIGVLVPCAAIETSGYFVDTSLEQHLALIQMDVVAPMALVHHFAGKMVTRGRGAVLLVSSLSGWMAQPYMAHYGAAKAYVLGLGDALYHEMKGTGVDVSVLSPGPTETPMLAATGIDFGSMGMAVMTPAAVAAHGLATLGRAPDAIPGVRNRMMVFMMTRLMPRGWVGALFRKMMGKALKIGAKPAQQARMSHRLAGESAE